MRKPAIVIITLLVPILLVAAGIYFKLDWLLSIGCVVFIFYIVMALRGKFSDQKKNENT